MTICGALLLCLIPSVFEAPAKQKETPPDPKRVEAVVSAAEAAFKPGGASEQRIAALKECATVPDPAVVRAVEKGLKDSDAAVKSVAIDTLGRMRIAPALKALHSHYTAHRKSLDDDETLPAELIRAIGRHADESSVDLIAEDLFAQRTYPAVQARIMALGNIRSVKAARGLMEMLVKVGERKADPFMPDVRMAMMHITGVDNGPISEAWTKWWQEKKNNLTIPAEAPKMPDALQRAWDDYWGPTSQAPVGKQ